MFTTFLTGINLLKEWTFKCSSKPDWLWHTRGQPETFLRLLDFVGGKDLIYKFLRLSNSHLPQPPKWTLSLGEMEAKNYTQFGAQSLFKLSKADHLRIKSCFSLYRLPNLWRFNILCLFIVLLILKVLGQISHLKDFSLEWTIMCLARFHE